MNSEFICSIHQVRFGSEVTAETKEADKELAKIPKCPVCAWKEFRAMQSELDMLRRQRDCLILAIELKQQHLIIYAPRSA